MHASPTVVTTSLALIAHDRPNRQRSVLSSRMPDLKPLVIAKGTDALGQSHDSLLALIVSANQLFELGFYVKPYAGLSTTAGPEFSSRRISYPPSSESSYFEHNLIAMIEALGAGARVGLPREVTAVRAHGSSDSTSAHLGKSAPKCPLKWSLPHDTR